MSSLSKRTTRGIRRELSAEEKQEDDEFYKKAFGNTDLDDEDNFSSDSDDDNERNNGSPGEDMEALQLLQKEQYQSKSNLNSTQNICNQEEKDSQKKRQRRKILKKLKDGNKNAGEDDDDKIDEEEYDEKNQNEDSDEVIILNSDSEKGANCSFSKKNKENGSEKQNNKKDDDINSNEQQASDNDSNGNQIRRQIQFQQGLIQMQQQQQFLMQQQMQSQYQMKIQRGIGLMNHNLHQFPYVRGFHYETILSDFERHDVSYIKYKDQFTYQGNSPDLNREYLQAAKKIQRDTPELVKTDYQAILFGIEDEKWAIDSEIQLLKTGLRYVKKLLKESNESNFTQNYNYEQINNMKLFGTINILLSSTFSLVENLKEKLEQRIASMENLREEKKNTRWNQADKIHFHPSLDQLFYQEKVNCKRFITIKDQVQFFINKQRKVDEISTLYQQIAINKSSQNAETLELFKQQKEAKLKEFFNSYSYLSSFQSLNPEADDIFALQGNNEGADVSTKERKTLFKQQKIQFLQDKFSETLFEDNRDVKAPGFIFQFQNKEALQFTVNLLGANQQFVNIPEFITNKIKKAFNVFSKDLLETDLQPLSSRKLNINMEIYGEIKEILANSIKKEQLEPLQKLFDFEKSKFEENYKSTEEVREENKNEKIKNQQSPTRNLGEEIKFLQSNTFYPQLKKENYLYGTAFTYVLITYFFMLYERVKVIFETLEHHALGEQELLIPENLKQKIFIDETQSKVTIKEFIEELIIAILENSIEEIIYEEIIKEFKQSRCLFIGIRNILQAFKRSLDYLLNDPMCAEINICIQKQPNESEEEQAKQNAQKELLKKEIKRIYQMQKVNNSLGTLISRISYDSTLKMVYVHQFPIKQFNFMEVIELENTDSEQEEEKLGNNKQNQNKFNNNKKKQQQQVVIEEESDAEDDDDDDDDEVDSDDDENEEFEENEFDDEQVDDDEEEAIGEDDDEKIKEFQNKNYNANNKLLIDIRQELLQQTLQKKGSEAVDAIQIESESELEQKAKQNNNNKNAQTKQVVFDDLLDDVSESDKEKSLKKKKQINKNKDKDDDDFLDSIDDDEDIDEDEEEEEDLEIIQKKVKMN